MASGAAVAGEPLSRCSAVTMPWPSATPVKYGVVAPGKTIFGVVCRLFGTYYFQLPAECEVNYDDVHGICTGWVASFDRDRGDFTFEFPTPEGSEPEVDTEWLPHADFKILEQVQAPAPGTDIFWPLSEEDAGIQNALVSTPPVLQEDLRSLQREVVEQRIKQLMVNMVDWSAVTCRSARLESVRVTENPHLHGRGPESLWQTFIDTCVCRASHLSQIVIAVHGTAPANIDSILKKGLALSKRSQARSRSRYGVGDYFGAQIADCVNYCRGGQQAVICLLITRNAVYHGPGDVPGSINYVIGHSSCHLPIGVLHFDNMKADDIIDASQRQRLEHLLTCRAD